MKDFLRWLQVSERTSPQQEGAELFFLSEREARLQRIVLPSLIAFGFLSHLLIFWLLSFPYVYLVEGICEVDCVTPATGWQAGGFVLVLPVISYLVCLISLLGKARKTEKWPNVRRKLNGLLRLNILLNLGGFLFVCIGLVLFPPLLFPNRVIDLYEGLRLDPSYGLHLLLLLFAVIASSGMGLVLDSWLRRYRQLR